MNNSSLGNDVNDPKFFFKPLFPHFLTSFELPDSFTEKVKGHGLGSVALMRRKLCHNQHWVVRIEQGRNFNIEDWNRFAVHHQLRVGDFLIFRHLGHFVFNVTVIDGDTACNSSFLPPIPRENTRPNEEEQEQEHEVPSRSLKRTEGGSPLPSFNFTLTSYSARRNIIYLPKKFTRECGLAVRCCEVTLIDPKKRSWQVGINYKKCDGQSYICRGWREIQDTNLIKPGDEIKLETLNIGKHPVFKFCVTACDSSLLSSKPRENTWQTQKLQERGHEVPSRSCNFRLSPSGARSNVITIPKKFIRENKLPCKRCEVTLVDEKKRSWQVWLNYNKSSGQWVIKKAFQDTNMVKSGDLVKLEIFRGGKHPVFKCSVTACNSSLPSSKPLYTTRVKQEYEENEEHEVAAEVEVEDEAPSRKRKRGRLPFPSCNLTLSHYRAHYSIDYLPKRFIRDSGLIHRRCEVTVIDQKRRSWQVGLNYKKSDGQSYISKGWKSFQEANLLKPGDVIKLQTLNAGKYPVLKCSFTGCNSSLPTSKPRQMSQVKQETEEVEGEVVEEEEPPNRMKKTERSPFPSCNFTLTPYQASCRVVSLPMKFIRDGRLFRRRCGVTLIDEEKRSWEAELNFRKGDGVSYICRGWKGFQKANLLKPGDAIKLQIIDAGKHPVFKCSRLSTGSKSA